ncbi:hypothetical protein [uncultured Parvibaculum sp.]|uniref:hypothetical protein n=1 Tax=uncultured Parvibaculum sp. TaxID=291828 RepID=UPI0030D6DB29
MALKIARTLLLLAVAIYGTAFVVGYFGVSYHGLAIVMAFGATVIMFLAAVACIVIQFGIPLLKDRTERKN